MPPILALIGPTASGKTSLALAVARRLGEQGRACEIVNADSMLVYRGMDIGTAKPSSEELATVPHHLVDIADITWSASIAEFQVLARRAIADIRARRAVPLVVGGSALYLHAVLDELEFPPTDAGVRARWQGELERIGAPALHAVLAERNPEVAGAILPGNGRRIVRALEVIELRGTFTPVLPEPRYALTDVHQFGLRLSRAEVDRRIAARVESMWTSGLVEEVKGLERVGLRQGLTASRALGYRQVLAYLDGELTHDQAKQSTIEATRRFAHKQETWFKRDRRVVWLDPTRAGAVDTIVAAGMT